ncbi:hypothetical protein [Hymenobacter persicinus]|uniref:Uncharacterized protein n=1 Tax=Hymenobacter persicinus TaxID=2025506 RepID=A0A4Q5LE48_9BACT|nr:hypothetical protein [Hymenobacter persicinus]RYU80518.1 hypothetical protein EWM57_08475 [Hymenobacter persicinus]
MTSLPASTLKKLLLVLGLFLAGLLALRLWLTPSHARPPVAAIPLVRKSAQAAPTPKLVRTVPALPVVHPRR